MTFFSVQTLGGHHPTTTWAPQTGRVLEVLGGQTRAQVLTGAITSRADVAPRTSMGVRTSMAERRAGDLDQDTREGGATGGPGTGGEGGTGGAGALMRGSAVESSEVGETTGEGRGLHLKPADPAGLNRPPLIQTLCSFRFRGGGPGRPGGRGYPDEYGGQEEGYDGAEEMGRGWEGGGRGRAPPRGGGGPPRGGKGPGSSKTPPS